LAQNTIASNAGNLIFGQAVHRTLSTPDTEIVPDSFLTGRPGANAQHAARINEEFDAYVVPLANAFRTKFAPNLKRLTRVIRHLDIPVVVVGVGSQHPLKGATSQEDPIAAEVKDFMSAVLDRSASVGVRGEATAAYLKGLGFGDEHVEVIGCPSIFLNGPSPRVTKRVEALDAQSRIALNISPYVQAMAAIAMDHQERYPNLMYIPQVKADLAMLLWGEQRQSIRDFDMPVHTRHPLFEQDRMRFPLDPQTWMNYLRGFDFSFGTRIHGNIAAILAGTPAMVLAHDSRTRELAEYYDIPHRHIDQLPEAPDAAQLYEEVDYSRFHAGLPERFGRYTSFLERNGLAHIYQVGNANTKYDDQMAAAKLPPMVATPMSGDPEARHALLDRLHWLHQGHEADRLRTAYRYEAPFSVDRVPAPDPFVTLQTEVERLAQELAESQKQIRRLLARSQQVSRVNALARRFRAKV